VDPERLVRHDQHLLPARRQEVGQRLRGIVARALAQREHAQAAAQKLARLGLPVADERGRAADDCAAGEGRASEEGVALVEHGPEERQGLEGLAQAHLFFCFFVFFKGKFWSFLRTFFLLRAKIQRKKRK
jgi:hypothetical protein